MKKTKNWFQKIYGAIKAEIEANQPATIPGDSEPAIPSPAARRGKHSDFCSKSMRRGVQLSKERKQRVRRLELIAESQRQGVRIATIRRMERIARREIAQNESAASV